MLTRDYFWFEYIDRINSDLENEWRIRQKSKMTHQHAREKKEVKWSGKKLHQKDKPSVICVSTIVDPMLNGEKFPFFFVVSFVLSVCVCFVQTDVYI